MAVHCSLFLPHLRSGFTTRYTIESMAIVHEEGMGMEVPERRICRVEMKTIGFIIASQSYEVQMISEHLGPWIESIEQGRRFAYEQEKIKVSMEKFSLS